MISNNAFLLFIASLLASLVLGYPAKQLAHRFGLIDIPGSAPHKQHTRPTPLAGGILILLTVVLMAVLFRQWLTHEITAVLWGAAIILLFGLWDDFMGLSAFSKLIGQILASVVLIASGVQVHFLSGFTFLREFPGIVIQVLDWGMTVFWVVGIANAMNMVDSINGLVAGLGMLSSVFFFGATTLSGQTALAAWSVVLLGISGGLYFWNTIPSHFFLGDSGAQTLGFMLAALGILYNPPGFKQESSWFVPIMLMSIPIFDTSLVVFSRLKQKQPVMQGRRDHTYHRLVGMGLSPNQAILIIHAAALAINGLAFFALSLSPVWANLTFGLSVLCGLIVLFWFRRSGMIDSTV